MGIDIHANRFLKYCPYLKPLGTVMTLGRQYLYHQTMPRDCHKPCESFIVKWLNAVSVDSVDASSYEGAKFIHDLNLPLDSNLSSARYATILDIGTLEHIFNLPQAFSNLASMLRNDGQFIHVMPSDGFCGHGFW